MIRSLPDAGFFILLPAAPKGSNCLHLLDHRQTFLLIRRKPAKMLISVAPAGLEKMFFEFGVPLAEGTTTALPPTKEEIEKLLVIAPRYGIEIRLPGH